MTHGQKKTSIQHEDLQVPSVVLFAFNKKERSGKF